MFLLRKSQQLSNKQMQPGQTLFQYLKRKKQIALRQSVQKELQKNQSRYVENQSTTRTYINQKKSQQQSVMNSARSQVSTKRRQKKSSNKKKKLMDSSLDSSKNSKKKRQKENNSNLMNLMDNEIFKDEKTTRRIILHSRDTNNMSVNLQRKKQNDQQLQAQQNKSRTRTPFRSFISMISPLKNRCENNLSTSLSNKNFFQKPNTVDQQPYKKGSIAKTAQFSTKKTIKQAMNKVQKHYNKKVEFQSTIKQKLKEFLFQVNSFLVHIEDDLTESDNNTHKKLCNLKSQMKILNSFIQLHIKQQQNQNIFNLIESLYEQINKNLNEYEGQVNKNSQSMCQQSIEKMKLQYQQQIQEMKKQNGRLGREVGVMNKENSKLVRDYDKLLEKHNQLLEQKDRIKKMKLSQQQQIRQLYEEQINNLTQINKNLQEQLKSTTKQLKLTQKIFQQYKVKVQTQRTQKTTVRESYLLKQISLLKQQCANDIENLNKYYVTKLEYYPPKIKVLEGIIEEQKLKISSMASKIIQMEDRYKNQDKEKHQIRVKLQQSLIDMCKINQELFKHWLALKDVKKLSLRLGMFDKFQRIYMDIPFDDRMFLL